LAFFEAEQMVYKSNMKEFSMKRTLSTGWLLVLVSLMAVSAFAQGPPASPRATSGLDGQVDLTWHEPGVIPGEVMFEGFEDGLPADWTVTGIAASPELDSWRVVAPFTAPPEGIQAIEAGDGAVGEFIDEWLITNPVEIGVLNSTLSFYHYATALTYDNAPNYLKISDDDGTTWNELLVWDPVSTPLPAEWTLEMVDLSDYIGATVQLAWEYTSEWGEFWYLDAIELSVPAVAALRPPVLDIPVYVVNDKTDYVEPAYTIIDNNTLSGWTLNNAQRELTGYEVLRDGTSLATVGTDVLSYVDYDVTNGTEYCYTVVALYPEGDEAAEPVCATPVNINPAIPTGLVGVVDGMVVTLDWDNNTDYDLSYYNVYRDGAVIGTSDVSNYTDEPALGGIYEYHVTAVDAEGAESEASEEVTMPVGNLPPMRLSAEGGLDGRVELEWASPGDDMPGLLDCADELIPGLPFSAVGTNLGMGDDFDVANSDGEDYTYQLWMPADGTVDITLCSAITTFDTKLEIFNADCFTTTTFYNDDFTCEFSSLQSTLSGIPLAEGIYLIVVDGFGGQTGDYEINVTESGTRSAYVAENASYEIEKLASLGIELEAWEMSSAPQRTATLREMTGYDVMRDGSLLASLGTDDLMYTDLDVTNGVEYCYSIVAVYDDGNAATPEVCATPINHIPETPTGLQGVVDGYTVTLDWNDNTDYDFDHYNVYRDGFVIGTSETSDFVEVLEVGGIFEYAVAAVDAEDAVSELSDDVTLPVGNLPPMRLSAESGLDGTVNLEWAEPGDLLPGLLDCGDELIPELPFTATGTNIGMGNDFDVSGGDGDDYAYQLWMPADGAIDISLCGASTDYDTKVEIFNADCFTTTGNYNDDDFNCEFSSLQSGLYNVFLPEGIYLIVVDGYSGGIGNFDISVTESAGRSTSVAQGMDYELQKLAADGIVLEPWEMSSAPQRTVQLREQTGYLVYRDGEVVSEELAVGTLTYTDQYIPNGVEYCYVVEAVYDDGNSASTPACATPMNHPPVAPMNLDFVIVDHDISLSWDANTTDYDFASYNVYRDGAVVANTTETTFEEFLELSNIYRYHVTSVDAEGAESANSNGVTLPVGNLPPAMANAESGLDGAVQLSWLPPGTVGGDGLYQDFESGIFPPADWSMMQTNVNATWQLYDDNMYEGLYSGGVWWDFEHQDEWLYTPEFNVGGGEYLTFWSYAQQASQYGDHYYVKVSVDGGVSWDVVLDMSALPVYESADGFNAWEEPYTIDLAAYAGQSVQIAFHAIDVDDASDPNYPGLWWIWLVDAITVGPMDGAATFTANTGMWGLTPENAARENMDQPYHTGDFAQFESQMIYSPIRDMRTEMTEYRIYRSLSSPVMINDTDLLVTLGTDVLDYYDFEPLTNGTDYYYVIAANYPDDEEISISAELMATPMNHAPAAPMGLSGVGDEDINVSLVWDDNDEYDFASYNVYRDGEFVANIAQSDFTEQLTEPGVYEYMVTAVDAEDAESAPSEGVMVGTGPLPPERLYAESGLDGQVYLTWAAPGDIASILDIEILTDNYPGETSWELYNDAGEMVASAGGLTDANSVYTWEYELPPGVYTYTIYDAFGDGICCAYGEGYYSLTINGMNFATGGEFGTEESITFNGSGVVTARTMSHFVGTPVGVRGQMPYNYSQLEQVTENIDVPVQQDQPALRTFDGFQVYRDGVAVSDVLPIDTYSYMDGWNVEEDLANGTEYCYTVAAVYTAATTQSNVACAIPVNHMPDTPANLTVVVNDETSEVTLDWDDVMNYDMNGYNVYVNDEMHVWVEGSEMVEIMEDGTYHFVVRTLDNDGMESAASQRVLAIVGEAPPENLTANGNFDDHIQLNWSEPGAGGANVEFRYDDDFATGQLGFNGGPPNGIMGAAHPVNASLSSVSWYLTAEGGPHTEVKIFVFGLDAAGVPDVNQVLHVSEMIPNTDETWNDYELPEAVTSETGFFMGINTPGLFTALGTDDGVGAPWEFVPGTQWGIFDYTTGNADWLELGSAGFEVNFLIRGYGQSFAALTTNFDADDYRQDKAEYLQFAYGEFPAVDVTRPSQTEANREITGYSIYRDGDEVGTTTETTFNDYVEENTSYFYEVTATYANGESSAPTDMIEARANMAPGAPTNVSAQVTGHLVAIEWEDPTVNMDGSECNDLEGIRILRDGVQIAVVDIYEWIYIDVGVSDGPHTYELIGFDEVPNYGMPATVEAYIGPAPYVLQIMTDNYPGETSWDIMDLSGNIVQSVAANSLADANTLYEWMLELAPGDYVFNIYDAYGDGICCTFGEGYYQILNGNEIVVGPGGDFTDVESTPFTVSEGTLMGDLNGDGVLDILDITRLIEIVTQIGDDVTPDELAVLDINGDGAYNVLDVVILIENVLSMPGLAKDAPVIKDLTVVVEPVTLTNNREWQTIPVTVNYEGLISGFQADLVFDASVVELGMPELSDGNDNVAIYSSLNENTMRVLAIDLTGGQIDLSSGLLMNVPVQVIDENATGATDFTVEELILSGPGGVEIETEVMVSVIEIGLPAPTEFALQQNYPNPFNPTTHIRYDIAEAGNVRLVIYNMLGQQVRTLVTGAQDVGRYEVMWNGLNDAGQPVATGIYVYHFQAGSYSQTHKMAFIK